MPVIYFDNYRGFDKTFLPLNNVNFFVGENSSGKTSVLKLIKILSDQKFWFTQIFASDEVDLGYYKEIASSSSSKKFFEIAILGNEEDKLSNISAVKFKFEDKDGIPAVREISMIVDNINIQTIIGGDHIKYRYEIINLENITEITKVKYFKFWVEKNTLSKKRFVVADERYSMFKNAIFLYIQQIIADLPVNDKNYRFSYGIPNFLQDMTWLAPIRTEPKRTYDSHKLTFSPDGTHAPYLLKKLLDEEKNDKNKYSQIIQKFGQDSGLFENINIKQLGKEQTAPFELQIILNNHKLKITNVGYGVSQILPLIIEVIARKKGTWFAIQQPEIHLHPRGQAAFGDFIFKSAVKEEKNFIIETHSDFTIDRYRLKLKNTKDKDLTKNLQSQIVFFNKKAGKNTLMCIPINNDGTFSDNQPAEFREFFIREQLELLSI